MKKLDQINGILQDINRNSVTPEEFTESIEIILSVVEQAYALTQKETEGLRSMFLDAVAELRSTNNEHNSATKARLITYIGEEMSKFTQVYKDKAVDIDEKLEKIPDEETIVDKVVKKIKFPEYEKVVLDTPEQVRDKLESLPNGERLRMSAIEELDETIATLQNRTQLLNQIATQGQRSSSSTSGTSASFVDNETVAGSGTAFTLANTPTSGSVHLYGLGQRLVLTTDYSITGTSVTTVSTWSAGDIVADYRK